MYKDKRFKALVLAGGSGSRMQSQTQKQYLEIHHKPMLYYSLAAFEESPVDEIILVVQSGEEDFCYQNIVAKYAFRKIKKIIAGGKERYHSTANGLIAANPCDYVLIHDAARPCLTADIISRCMDAVIATDACTAGVPAVDTINRVDTSRKILETLDRNQLWSVQTPQAFHYSLIAKAHELLRLKEQALTLSERAAITDDTKIASVFLGADVHMVEGSYTNIKVTTPADLQIAEVFLAAD